MSSILMDKYKILPKKTFDTEFKFPFETIPKELHRHFIRGFIDGDGCIGKRDLSFRTTSLLFLEQIIDIFSEYFNKFNVPFHYCKRLEKGKTVDC